MDNFYSRPITNLEEGQTYLRALHGAELMYHLEDDATDIMWSDGDVTDGMMQAFNDRSEELYELDWGKFECPIGFVCSIFGRRVDMK